MWKVKDTLIKLVYYKKTFAMVDDYIMQLKSKFNRIGELFDELAILCTSIDIKELSQFHFTDVQIQSTVRLMKNCSNVFKSVRIDGESNLVGIIDSCNQELTNFNRAYEGSLDGVPSFGLLILELLSQIDDVWKEANEIKISVFNHVD
jgi:hypothetical protein